VEKLKKFFNQECPICSGAKKRCSYAEKEEYGVTTRLIFCKGETNNPDYKCIGNANITNIPMWVYKPEQEEKYKAKAKAEGRKYNSKYSQQDNQHYLAEREAKRKEEERRIKQKIKNSLSLQKRDLEIRKIVSQLNLNENHETRLLERGLTENQIEKNGYCSAHRWQKLGKPIDERLAGIRGNGYQINNPGSGIIAPIINEDGLFVGLRINNDRLAEKERDLGKYTYISSPFKNVDNNIPVTESLEEPPIAVHYPEKWTDFSRIGICEGLEYKSAIAANRLGYPVIGFSGNDFTSSPKLLKRTIEKITKKALSTEDPKTLLLNPRKSTISILPDSGTNQSVSTSYIRGIETFVEKLDHDIDFGYWNHLHSKGRDIDDIPTETKINYLSPEEAIKRLQFFSQKGFDVWNKSRNFTSDKNINYRWLSESLMRPPNDGQIFFIKSGLGTGKTTLLNQWLQNKLKDYGAFSLGCRNTLTRTIRSLC